MGLAILQRGVRSHTVGGTEEPEDHGPAARQVLPATVEVIVALSFGNTSVRGDLRRDLANDDILVLIEASGRFGPRPSCSADRRGMTRPSDRCPARPG